MIMDNFAEIFRNIDTAMTAELQGTLAALSLAAAAFILGPIRPSKTPSGEAISGHQFLLAFIFFLTALLIDLGLAPLVMEVVSATMVDLDGNVPAEVSDASVELVLFVAGTAWLFQGARSMASTLDLELITPTKWPFRIKYEMLQVASELKWEQLAVLKSLNQKPSEWLDVASVQRGSGAGKINDITGYLEELIEIGCVIPNKAEKIKDREYQITLGGQGRLPR